jgi:hypothetical protein
MRDEEAGVADNSLRIWALLCIELWHREVLGRQAGETLDLPAATAP